MRWLRLVSLCLAACAPPEPSAASLALELRAMDGHARPLSGVRAWLDGAPLGTTKGDGVLRATLRARPQQRVRLSWACPAAYEPPSEERDLVLGPPPAARGPEPPPLKLEARCRALEIDAALVVRATGAPREGIPILVRGEVVARTDADGLAHLVLRARRGSALTVALDTGAYPRLIPASPLETFQLGDTDTILLLDRVLTTAPPKARRPAKKPKLPDRPVRIQ